MPNPCPEVEVATVDIPDDTDFSTGRLTAVFKPKAFATGNEILIGIINLPRFQGSISVNRARSLVTIMVLEGVPSDLPPPVTLFKLPKYIKAGANHTIAVQFSKWQVETAMFDNASLPIHKEEWVTKPVEILESPQPDIATPVGTVVIKWSRLEQILRDAFYRTIGLPEDLCRVIARDPRPAEIVEMIRDVLKHRGIEIEFDYASLAKRLTNAKLRRDQIAHGVFVRDPESGGAAITDFIGQWDTGPRGEKWKKKIRPGIQIVDTKFWAALEAEVDELIVLSAKLHDGVMIGLNPSLGKST